MTYCRRTKQGRVELLDSQRLMMQPGRLGASRKPPRVGLSIDHSPGGHDDVANAVAGQLVSLDLEQKASTANTASDAIGIGAGCSLISRSLARSSAGASVQIKTDQDPSNRVGDVVMAAWGMID